MSKPIQKIALVGNPNTGKSSIFNWLTGLNQKVGNFPGVTVDRKSGSMSLGEREVEVVDFPGTYSFFAKSEEEKVVQDVLMSRDHADFPDVFVVVMDKTQWVRNFVLFSQLYDAGFPLLAAITMGDREVPFEVDIESFQQQVRVPVININGRSGAGIDKLKQELLQYKHEEDRRPLVNANYADFVNNPEKQIEDTKARYHWIQQHVPKKSKLNIKGGPGALDRWLIHPIWGYVIFLTILLVIFQFIFRFSTIPMDWIDAGFTSFAGWLQEKLPHGLLSELITEGLIPGIGGVCVFIPQIALLFFFLSILEETGYMSRAIFIMDRLVRPFGLNGKSVVPLMSSVACAIPGVMSARTISNGKDRLITILVAPLMSCSARIPVYTLLIALVIPKDYWMGWVDLQGMVLLGLYLLGLVTALMVSWIAKKIIHSAQPGFMVMEIPALQPPLWRQVFLTMWEKVRVFVLDAGKVIITLSILIWALASFGPSERKAEALKNGEHINFATAEDSTKWVASVELENSYIGIMGKAIEPVIAPIGFDWKIGISIITSFAAREVFVGSLATIYAIGEEEGSNERLIEKMRDDKRLDNGKPVFTLASGGALLVFYVFAMQCLATFAVVYRETKTWRWPLIQVFYMGILAYVGAFVTFYVLS